MCNLNTNLTSTNTITTITTVCKNSSFIFINHKIPKHRKYVSISKITLLGVTRIGKLKADYAKFKTLCSQQGGCCKTQIQCVKIKKATNMFCCVKVMWPYSHIDCKYYVTAIYIGILIFLQIHNGNLLW